MLLAGKCFCCSKINLVIVLSCACVQLCLERSVMKHELVKGSNYFYKAASHITNAPRLATMHTTV